MAKAVEQALQERRHLIVEAGTGTSCARARRNQTGTKTLQEQLFFKDVPFLREHLGELRVCYMKGRGNYLCRKKLYDLTAQPLLKQTGRDQPLPHHQRLGKDHRKRRPRGVGRTAGV